MSDHSDIATLVVAIIAVFFTLSPIPLAFIKSVHSTILRAFWPKYDECERMEWIDVSDGLIHQCTIPAENCEHEGGTGTGQNWNIIGSFFNWKTMKTSVRKPRQLDLMTTYIRTDTRTIKALLSLVRGLESRIVFKEVDTIMTAYFTPDTEKRTNLQYRVQVTKNEMDRILEGYPPWYEDSLRLPNGDLVLHPLHDFSNIFRGGWIVALGLTDTLPTRGNFMELELAASEKVNPKAVTRGLERVQHCLSNIAKAFPQDEKAERARKNIMLLSRNPSHSAFSRFRDYIHTKFSIHHLDSARDLANGFTNEQFLLAMQVFTHVKELSILEVKNLEPVLERVGVKKVLMHFTVKRRRHEIRIPPELTRDRYIYVRQRREDYED